MNAWTNWVCSHMSFDTIPSVECPIWKERLDTTQVTFRQIPSATRPTMMIWDGKGLLWKRESGSVDRMIEYSIAFCSEALLDAGILNFPQTWYDVHSLKRDVVAI